MYQIDYDSLQKENPMLGRKVFPGQVVRVPAQSFEFENTPVSPGKQVVENKEPVREQQMEEESTPKTCNPIPHTETFKVALMVPLYLSNVDSLEKTKFMLHDQKHFAPFTFIHFLQGGLLAADLMKKQGMKLQLYVYDVDQQLTKTAEVLSRPELKNMDLIIGPFYSRSFDQVSMFAAHFGIPIVNPLTFRKEVLSQDEGVIKVKPGYEYLPTLLKRYIAGQDRYDKVFIIHQDYNDQAVVNRLTDTIAKVLPPTISFSDSTIAQLGVAVTQREKEKARQDLLDKMKADPNHEIYPADTTLNPVTTTINDTLQPFLLENNMVFPDSLKYYATDSTTLNNRLINIRFATDSLHPFEDNASVLRKNLVIVYSKNKPFVMDVMNRLNVIRDTFHVKMIGLPDWENYTEMDYHQMNNLNLTYPASHYVNLTAPETKDLDSLFAKHFGSMPEVYGNLGFDITYYFLNALYYHGHQMTTCLPFYPYKGISTEFHFKPAQKKGNYENSYWNLLQIKDMKLHSIPDSLFEKHPSPLVPENYDQ
jgi:hypothetical protein